MVQRTIAGNARIDIEDEYARLILRPAPGHEVALAQLDDHHARQVDPAGERFAHRPPVRVTLYARASPARPGASFGFGFWNDPFATTGTWPAGPRCIGFYAVRPSTDATQSEWMAGVWNDAGRDEAALADVHVTDWHRYEIEWHADVALVRVDRTERLRVAAHLPGPLGFAIWITNRVITVPPEGNVGMKLCRIDSEQWLEVKSLKIERLLEIRNL